MTPEFIQEVSEQVASCFARVASHQRKGVLRFVVDGYSVQVGHGPLHSDPTKTSFFIAILGTKRLTANEACSLFPRVAGRPIGATRKWATEIIDGQKVPAVYVYASFPPDYIQEAVSVADR